MNGDEKEEAHRPRPLSAGIWTLFSWLRRSERSSSSESVSSIGSARTAVSFDFLAPGNCNFTKTPIVLTTPLNPPTETYKRRLHERNLRRQRDRDVTLHRKYGLFREHGTGYEGFTLPAARRTVGNTVDRPNRDRRATSECLQRRAAYVPGKRRAPLPPETATSVSLPRTYKRKRPAPKPPVKNNTINNPERMTSNTESKAKFIPDNEILNSSKTQKCDKKITTATSKDNKVRTDKNFLKHIFENRKRSSVIETTTVKLLPSISELDKQATEIIENNKLRQKLNNINPNDFDNSQDTTTSYEGNSWFCTSCLRKYNASIDSCNYCLPDKRRTSKKDGFVNSSPRSSIYTQTNINDETAHSSGSNMDEKKMLKEILKEMKDSLPKKNKGNKINDCGITEIPTLRIGTTVEEIYKGSTSKPTSSTDILHNKSKILSISSLLSEPHRNYDRKVNSNQHESSPKLSDFKNTNKFNVTSAFENKNNDPSTSARIVISPQEHLITATNNYREKNKNGNNFQMSVSNKTKNNFLELDTAKATEDKNIVDAIIKDTVNFKFNSNGPQVSLLSTKTNDSKESNKRNQHITHNSSTNIKLGERQYFLNDEINLKSISNDHKKVSKSSSATNISTEMDKIQQKPSNLQFIRFPDSRTVVVNSVTLVTSQSSDKASEIQGKIPVKNTETNFRPTNISRTQNESKMKDNQIPSQFPGNSNIANNKTSSNTNYLELKATLVKSPETSVNNAKPEYNLHTPLNISSLLNPLQHSNKPILKENISMEVNTRKPLQKEITCNSNALKTLVADKDDPKVNKQILDPIPMLPIVTVSSLSKPTYQDNGLIQTQTKETEPRTKHVTLKDEYVQKVLPSTSRCSSSVTGNSNNEVDKLDHYDRRRHLINQLEQSIAKGDEAAAAEAAVKLAKLRLSCSVLSFSSQIVGETSNSSAKQNETNEQCELLDTNTSSKDKPSTQSMPKPQIAETVQNIKINIQTKKIEPVKKLPDNKEVIEKAATENGNVSHMKQHSTSEPSSSRQIISEDIVPINVWIEDKQAARGPIRLNISRQATMADLRRQAEHSLGLATQLQRWIIGRTLCSDDASLIVALAGPNLTAPFYLCVVQPDHNDNPKPNEKNGDGKSISATNQNGEFYTELMKLEKQSLVPNIEPFECGVCMEECAVGAGVILRECIHTFCRECLSDVVQHSQEPAVACPAMGCSGFLQEREIRTIVTSEEYERWLARGLATAECGTRNAFHCRTRDCTGWAFCDPGVRRFPCPVCNKTNCVQCQAIHEGETCEQYQTKLRQAVTAAETNKDDEGTQALLNSLISRGEALECPECRAIITKKWGCDWVKCSACKTEICWVTKGRRWGPGGRGDTSGGCRCGVDGQRCHPSCGYCH